MILVSKALSVGAILIIVAFGLVSYFNKQNIETGIDPTPTDVSLVQNDTSNTDSSPSGTIERRTMSQMKKPDLTIDTTKNYQAVISTSKGDITVNLFQDKTPITVNNFVYLANEGFYDGTIFHRVIRNFMIQGGDPLGNGTGGPGYKFDDEPFDGDYSRGTLAMANSGQDTNGSQFFIMHQDNDLAPDYVIFGEVVTGIETVDSIAEAQVKPNARGEMSVPVEPVTVNSVTITTQ